MTNKVYDDLKKISLKLKYGEKLPSERDLASIYKVARNTIIQLLGELEGEGIIWRKAKSGWFKSPPRFEYCPQKSYTFDSASSAQDFESNVELICCEIDKDKLFNDELGKALVIQRKKELNGRPVMIEKTYVAENDFPDLKHQDLTKSLTELFANKYDFVANGMDIDMKSHTFNPTESNILQCSVGLPSLIIKRTFFKDSKVKQIDLEIWRFDAISLKLENI